MLASLHQLEAGILLWLQNNVRCLPLTAFLVPLTIIGNHGELWIVISLLLMLSPKTRKGGVLGLFSLLLCFLFNDLVLKVLIARSRPFVMISALEPLVKLPGSHSFPSGHSNSSFAAACGQLRGVPQKWLKVLLLFLAAAMAFSRLYVGVHYPTDVLAGALEGIAGSALVWHFCSQPYDRLALRLRQRKEQESE